MPLTDLLLPTTVVGSYPVVRGKGLRALLDPLRPALETAINDQVNAGVDIISDGQVRGEMIQIFTTHLPGVRGQQVIGKVLPAAGSITVHDTRFALTKTRYVKGILTGPSTLAHGLQLATPHYRSREELVPDIATALVVEAIALEEAGVAMIQIDEPIFSTGAPDLDIGGRAVELIADQVSVPVALHTCGDLSQVIDRILSIRVDIHDCEFATCPANLDLFSARDLGKKKIGLGCLDSSSDSVESVDVIARLIRNGVDRFGANRLLIDPDCGMRMRIREAASAKLVHMVEATGIVRSEL
ncbi:methionine synthase [Methanosphaerula palustris]|uniref:Methionine synthase vitamin-B12 independent n=1 Tax=Methanosphaerula palustris (strain ATCC BAA-1556 / DSM 19958 / E1-9c) TaxID=521011 RepID=B8GJ85_METPE|nr:methionine synthase [Methanosphaerula palustris]ACL15658.1 Methionine synthase vitamin-B12 independent [Methanosphaerula palustris E1-9c]